MVLLDPPCSYDRRVPAFSGPDPAIIGTVACLRRCILPPTRGQPLNSDLRRARIRLVPVGVRIKYSSIRANYAGCARVLNGGRVNGPVLP